MTQLMAHGTELGSLLAEERIGGHRRSEQPERKPDRTWRRSVDERARNEYHPSPSCRAAQPVYIKLSPYGRIRVLPIARETCCARAPDAHSGSAFLAAPGGG